MFSDSTPYQLTGTSAPLFVPRQQDAGTIRSGKDYFFVQIHGAQAAFRGPFWEHVKNLIIASKVDLKHKNLGDKGLVSIQRTRAVARNQASQLGLRPNLIDLVPAVMPTVSLSIEYILDKENYLNALGGLINSDAFLATVSLAPGAAAIAKTISGLAEKIIETFIPATERTPILEFSGDFNIAVEGDVGENYLRDGYYVIFGSRDEKNPLPSVKPSLEVEGGQVYINKSPATHLSYVILDVYRTSARQRARSNGAPWDERLREAEDEASRIGNDPSLTDKERKSTWEKCRSMLRDGQVLLRADPNYHRSEAEAIFLESFNKCLQSLGMNANMTGGGIVKAARGGWKPDVQSERSAFEISAGLDVLARLKAYRDQVEETQRYLESVKE